MNAPFKEGDKIRFLDVSGVMGAKSAGFHNGDIVKVHSVSWTGAPRVKTPDGVPTPLMILKSELHNVVKVNEEAKRMGQVSRGELREGDKVVITNVGIIVGGRSHFNNGDITEVLRIDSDGDVYLKSKKRMSHLIIVGDEYRALRHYTPGDEASTPLRRGDLKVGDKVKIVDIGAIVGGRDHFDTGDVTTVKSMDSDGDVRLTSLKIPGTHLFITKSELRGLARFVEAPQNDRLAEILAQVEALVAEARTLSVDVPPASVTLSRVEDSARVDVAELEERMMSFHKNDEGNDTFRSRRTRVEFQVNTKKNVVTALVRLNVGNEVIEKGFAKTAPGDTFSEEIGKAIALRRALGLDVPTKYTTLGGR